MTDRAYAKAVAAVKAVITQAGDPKEYRLGLAQHAGVPVETIDAIIAEAGAPRKVSEEIVARERLAQDRAYSRTHRAAWREANHEEE